MALRDATADPDELAALYAALAHPTRVEILRVLRATPAMTLRELRKALAERKVGVDTTTLLHHLQKMHVPTVIDLTHDQGALTVRLVRDLALRTKLIEQSASGPSA